MSNFCLQHRGALRLVILGHTVAITVGLAATVAHADMLDFEDLPSLLEQFPQCASAPLGPNFAYHGFTFSSDDLSSSLPPSNSWWYGNMPEDLQDPPYQWDRGGLPWGIQSGEFTLRSSPGYGNPSYSYSVSRSDGGLWMMDGAWCARVATNSPLSPGSSMWQLGYVGATLVYVHEQTIFHGIRTFVAPPAIAIDRFRIGMSSQPSAAIGFYMDDFTYTLVPSPAPFALLGLVGMLRRSRRG